MGVCVCVGMRKVRAYATHPDKLRRREGLDVAPVVLVEVRYLVVDIHRSFHIFRSSLCACPGSAPATALNTLDTQGAPGRNSIKSF